MKSSTMIRILPGVRIQFRTRAQRKLSTALAVLWIMGLAVNSLNPTIATGTGNRKR
jgi:hypothetical protein